MSDASNELTNDVLENSIVESDTEVREDTIIEEKEIIEENREKEDEEQENEINEESDSESCSLENKEDINESVNHDDVYVENDVEGLERMLGIPASQEYEEEKDDTSVNEGLSAIYSLHDDLNENKEDVNEAEIKESDSLVIEENKEVEKELSEENLNDSKPLNKPVLFSDFMDLCDEDFTYLTHSNGSFNLMSIPMSDRREIKNAVKSSNYIFRYPKFILRDPVLGYEENVSDSSTSYLVYFPEYRLSFSVPKEYAKPFSTHFKEYFEDLITRYRPDNMLLDEFLDSVTITSIKVVETGIIEVCEEGELKQFILENNHVSFYDVLAYIRELSDLGDDILSLKLIPAYFSAL